jgi:hypothetical protein
MLLMGTATQESQLTYTRQLGGGPALGYFQMEPFTHDDCWNSYIHYRPDLKTAVLAVRNAHSPQPPTANMPPAAELETNPHYAAAMARVRYLRAPAAIPADPREIAAYWKLYYNTPQGAGSVEEFIGNWNRVLSPQPYAAIAEA